MCEACGASGECCVAVWTAKVPRPEVVERREEASSDVVDCWDDEDGFQDESDSVVEYVA